MSRIRARIRSSIRFRWEGRDVVAGLADAGWRCPAAPAVARALDASASPRGLSPAEGEPFARAAEVAARLLGGEPSFPTPAGPPGRLY